MIEMTQEEIYDNHPWAKKLTKEDVMALFFDITKFVLLGKEDPQKSDLINVLANLISGKK